MQLKTKHKKYKESRELVYSCQYHVVMCAHFKSKLFINGVDVYLKELLLKCQESYKFNILDMEILPDHIHLLLDANPRKGIYNIVDDIGGFTAHFLRKKFPELGAKGYSLWGIQSFISTVGSVSSEEIKKYIDNQEQ